MSFGKPKPQKTRRELKAAKTRALRPDTRQRAFTLDGGRCIWPSCRKALSLEFAHMHEVVWRGKGGDPTDIEIVVTTCASCHSDIHPRIGGVRKRMAGTRTTGFTFEERRGDTWVDLDDSGHPRDGN